MCPILPIFGFLLAVAPVVETQFMQVVPVKQEQRWWAKPQQTRAVVLIHGLYVHPFSKANVARPHLHSWQKPDCLLVKRLAAEADVFAFSYAQTASADDIADCPELTAIVRRLRRQGYREIVLLGHSAGGVIARQFVEDRPDCGVTKVIQVCAPNSGSGWALLPAVRGNQIEFLESLTKPARSRSLSARQDKRIPEHIEFACIVGIGGVVGDGMVLTRSQYPPDLQRQGVPAYPFNGNHWSVLRSARGAELVARLLREPQPRWNAKQVEAIRRQLLMD